MRAKQVPARARGRTGKSRAVIEDTDESGLEAPVEEAPKKVESKKSVAPSAAPKKLATADREEDDFADVAEDSEGSEYAGTDDKAPMPEKEAKKPISQTALERGRYNEKPVEEDAKIKVPPVKKPPGRAPKAATVSGRVETKAPSGTKSVTAADKGEKRTASTTGKAIKIVTPFQAAEDALVDTKDGDSSGKSSKLVAATKKPVTSKSISRETTNAAKLLEMIDGKTTASETVKLAGSIGVALKESAMKAPTSLLTAPIGRKDLSMQSLPRIPKIQQSAPETQFIDEYPSAPPQWAATAKNDKVEQIYSGRYSDEGRRQQSDSEREHEIGETAQQYDKSFVEMRQDLEEQIKAADAMAQTLQKRQLGLEKELNAVKAEKDALKAENDRLRKRVADKEARMRSEFEGKWKFVTNDIQKIGSDVSKLLDRMRPDATPTAASRAPNQNYFQAPVTSTPESDKSRFDTIQVIDRKPILDKPGADGGKFPNFTPTGGGDGSARYTPYMRNDQHSDRYQPHRGGFTQSRARGSGSIRGGASFRGNPWKSVTANPYGGDRRGPSQFDGQREYGNGNAPPKRPRIDYIDNPYGDAPYFDRDAGGGGDGEQDEWAAM